MAVYVDNAQIPYGRMKMSHMVADSTEELLRMADLIGLDRKHLQKPGTPYEHFDVSILYRARAVANGAREVIARDIVTKIREKRFGNS